MHSCSGWKPAVETHARHGEASSVVCSTLARSQEQQLMGVEVVDVADDHDLGGDALDSRPGPRESLLPDLGKTRLPRTAEGKPPREPWKGGAGSTGPPAGKPPIEGAPRREVPKSRPCKEKKGSAGLGGGGLDVDETGESEVRGSRKGRAGASGQGPDGDPAPARRELSASCSLRNSCMTCFLVVTGPEEARTRQFAPGFEESLPDRGGVGRRLGAFFSLGLRLGALPDFLKAEWGPAAAR